MSKAHRGTGIREHPNQGKATCPVCKRESVKCLYEVEVEGAKTGWTFASSAMLSSRNNIFLKKMHSREITPGFFIFDVK